MIDTTNPEQASQQTLPSANGAGPSNDDGLPLAEHAAAQSRLDPLTQQWTIFAPGRDQRPEEITHERETVDHSIACPFCVEQEDQTPPPVWIGQLADAGTDWSVRVVPNKFPAVEPMGPDTPTPTNTDSSHNGLFRHQAIRGGHEVFIESRQHVQSLANLDLAEVLLVFQAYRDRLKYWRSIPEIQYLSIFKNVGGKAGASLRHSHSQLIATDKMPASVANSFHHMNRHRLTTGCCLQCDLLRGEMKAKQRIVWHDGSVIAFCPFASRLPMTLRITSLKHQACFEDLDEKAIESVSRVVHRAVSWLERLRPNTSYNYCLHTRPPGANDRADAFHWSIDLFPRMTQVAGFEWSSDCMINPVLPEVAASRYRAIANAEDPRSALSS